MMDLVDNYAPAIGVGLGIVGSLLFMCVGLIIRLFTEHDLTREEVRTSTDRIIRLEERSAFLHNRVEALEARNLHNDTLEQIREAQPQRITVLQRTVTSPYTGRRLLTIRRYRADP